MKNCKLEINSVWLKIYNPLQSGNVNTFTHVSPLWGFVFILFLFFTIM